MGPQALAVPRREAHRSPHPRRRPPTASERPAPGQVPPPAGSTKRGSALAPNAPVPTHPSIAEPDRARAAGQEPRTGRLRENGGLACTETAERCRVPGSAPRPPGRLRTRRQNAHALCAQVKLLPSAARPEPAPEAARAAPPAAGGGSGGGAFPSRPQRRVRSAGGTATGQRRGCGERRGFLNPSAFPVAPPGPRLSRRNPLIGGREFRAWSRLFSSGKAFRGTRAGLQPPQGALSPSLAALAYAVTSQKTTC